MKGPPVMRLRAVLFDLDGTLIDSAPDLAGAGNDMRAVRGLAPYPLEHFRPMVGSGARGMMARAFEIGPRDEQFDAMRDEFLQRYETRMTRETRIFPDMLPLLEMLGAWSLPWGIVTNKATRFGEPIVRALGLRAATLVCGDTTAHAKPHPEPLLEAARRAGRPRRGYDHDRGRLGVSRPGRLHRGLGCRPHRAVTHAALEVVANGLN
jgi:N-acetyl-D-muramate 6-phosphate phosphatase